MNSARNVLLAVLFISAFALMGLSRASAAGTVTGAAGGSSISADTAANASSPAWTTLGAVTIAEGANADFAAGTNVTLILKAPSGFAFNTAVTPDVTATAGTNLTSYWNERKAHETGVVPISSGYTLGFWRGREERGQT